jgi:DNA-binding NtrC family response regulator
MTPRILIIDDDAAMCAMLKTRLGARNFQVTTETDPQAACALFEAQPFDAVVTDINMQGQSGVTVCKRLLEMRAGTPVILMTAYGSMDNAIEGIRAGAYDFLPKPFEVEKLVLVIERGVQAAALRREVVALQNAPIASSTPILALRTLIERVAQSDATVLISGESGTGKELVAQELHRRGPRAAGPIVAINCAAMPESLLESELFGHTRGAFTDARTAKPGLFVAAEGGTVFLDEIGELPLMLQAKLLRALQERKVRPVGATAETAFNARIIVATNRDLEAMIDNRTFRQDLYFRINVIQLALPPLRARGGDVLALAQYFIERTAKQSKKAVAGLASDAAQKLLAYSWPGNVRELENSIERAVALTTFDKISTADLPEKIRDYQSTTVSFAAGDPSALVPLEEMERRYILAVLEAVGGNKSKAARILQIERKTLYRMFERWGYPTSSDKGGASKGLAGKSVGGKAGDP